MLLRLGEGVAFYLTSRKNFLERACASGRVAENTGAPAGALSPALVANRANVLATIYSISVPTPSSQTTLSVVLTPHSTQRAKRF